MAIQTINIGTYANDGTGEDLRSAFNKINENFQELDLIVASDGSNIGTTGIGVFAGKVDDSGNIGELMQFRKIAGSSNISVNVVNNSIEISAPNSINQLVEDIDPHLGGNLILNNFSIQGTGNINIATGHVNAPTMASTFTGPLTGNVTGNLTGNVTGDTTGLHTGDVEGNVTGNLTGLHTGDVVGNVTGNLTGNVTGNVTGTLIGTFTGNATTATRLQNTRNINGIPFNGTNDIIVPASADTLYGTSLNSTVVNSQLTSVGTLTSLTVSGVTDLGEVHNVTITGGDPGQVLTTNGSGELHWADGTGGGGGGYADLESDPSPTLGANLDLNGFNIIGAGDITAATVHGIDVLLLSSLVSMMLESNSFTVDFGTFTAPTGDMNVGYLSDAPANDINFGTFV